MVMSLPQMPQCETSIRASPLPTGSSETSSIVIGLPGPLNTATRMVVSLGLASGTGYSDFEPDGIIWLEITLRQHQRFPRRGIERRDYFVGGEHAFEDAGDFGDGPLAVGRRKQRAQMRLVDRQLP